MSYSVETLETPSEHLPSSRPHPKLTSNAAIAISVSLTTCFVSFFLELRTLVVYRRLSPHLKSALRNDYLLLLYAIFGLVAQVLMAVYYVIMYPIARYVSGYVFVPGQFSMPYLTDLLALSGSICLFVTSNALRKNYTIFYGIKRPQIIQKVCVSTTVSRQTT